MKTPLLPTLLLAALVAAPASAAIIVTTDSDATSRTFFPVSNSDLINAGSAFLTSGPTYTGYTQLVATGLEFNPENIHDGSNNNVDGSIVQTGTLAANAVGNQVFTVDFFLGNNPHGNFGFDLSSITITSNGADRRVNQDIEVQVRPVGSASFVSLTRYQFTPNATGATGSFSAQAILTEDSGDLLLATGVDAIRFITFVAARGSAETPAHTVWSEFDVAGVASTGAIPEPSSAATLLGLVSLGAVALRRRR